MIKILYPDGVEQVVQPTVFPDKTTQVWKLGVEKYTSQDVNILWKWESEAEIIQLLQLKMLLDSYYIAIGTVAIPYIPYGRQDKEVSDEATFAKKLFSNIWDTYFPHADIEYIDIHSDIHNNWRPVEDKYLKVVKTDKEYIMEAIADVSIVKVDGAIHFTPVTLVYPDAGAARRYGDMFFEEYIVMNKVREQSTGNILGLEISQSVPVSPDTKFLIIDDICDGGYTFILAARALQEEFPDNEVNLYVSHGIFSKGLIPLRDAGIKRILTTDSLTEFRANYSFITDDYIEIVGDKL